jgi:hypothetical protein
MLVAETLPAPRGTPARQRVLALSDGTRILEEPTALGSGSWSFESIGRYVAWRTGSGSRPFRELPELLTDLEDFLRSRVWLPVDDQYLLAALYIVVSHIYQVFDAIPLILICGERATGKSELGEGISRLSFNATVAGQLRAAGMIRLLDETRGLLVLDDMDGHGAASLNGTGELAQALKTGYKRVTSVKPLADRGGRVRMVDFFGPKIVTNTVGVDAVLGSRMLAIRTAPISTSVRSDQTRWSDDKLLALRDELHCWGLASGQEVAARYRALGPPTCRRTEIEAPLLAIADVAGCKTIAGRLEACLLDPRTSPPIR